MADGTLVTFYSYKGGVGRLVRARQRRRRARRVGISRALHRLGPRSARAGDLLQGDRAPPGARRPRLGAEDAAARSAPSASPAPRLEKGPSSAGGRRHGRETGLAQLRDDGRTGPGPETRPDGRWPSGRGLHRPGAGPAVGGTLRDARPGAIAGGVAARLERDLRLRLDRQPDRDHRHRGDLHGSPARPASRVLHREPPEPRRVRGGDRPGCGRAEDARLRPVGPARPARPLSIRRQGGVSAGPGMAGDLRGEDRPVPGVVDRGGGRGGRSPQPRDGPLRGLLELRRRAPRRGGVGAEPGLDPLLPGDDRRARRAPAGQLAPPRRDRGELRQRGRPGGEPGRRLRLRRLPDRDLRS